MKSLKRIILIVSVMIVTLLLAGVAVIYFMPTSFPDSMLKDRIIAELAKAYPGYTPNIGSVHYNVDANRFECKSLSFTAIDSSFSCVVDDVTLAGMDRMGIILGMSRFPDNLSHLILDAKGIACELPNLELSVTCGRVHASMPDSEFIADSVTIDPPTEDKEFFGNSPYRKTRFNIAIGHCAMNGADVLGYLKGSGFLVRSVHLAHTNLDVLINKEKPSKDPNARQHMPNETVDSMITPVKIDTISFTDGHLLYGERMVANTRPALITVDSIQFLVEHIAIHADSVRDLLFHASGRLMGSCPMKVVLSFPLESPDFNFHFTGSAGKMELPIINPFLEVAEHKRFKVGHVQGATFEIHCKRGQATGHVRAVYKNLTLATLSKSDGSEKGIFQRIVSFLINSLKLRRDNVPDKDGKLKIGNVNYSRKPSDTFFQCLWFSLRGGLGDIIGASL